MLVPVVAGATLGATGVSSSLRSNDEQKKRTLCQGIGMISTTSQQGIGSPQSDMSCTFSKLWLVESELVYANAKKCCLYSQADQERESMQGARYVLTLNFEGAC